MSESPIETPRDTGGFSERGQRLRGLLIVEQLSRTSTIIFTVVAVALLGDYLIGDSIDSTAELIASIAFAGTCIALPVSTRLPIASVFLFMISGIGFVLFEERVGLISLMACVLVAIVATVSRLVMTCFLMAALFGWAVWISFELFADFSYLAPFALFTAPAALTGIAFRRVRQQLARTARRNRELARLRDEARTRERESLARDLHDVVSHQLTIISLISGSRRRSTDVEKLSSSLQEINELSGETLAELRKLLTILRDPAALGSPQRSLLDMSICEGVDYLNTRLHELGFDVTCQVDFDEDTPLSTSTVTSALRILQESSTNIAKYAESGSVVRIGLSCSDEWLSITVESHIPKKATERPRHAGLSSGQGIIGIKERAGLLGGHAVVGPVGKVWSVRVALPV